MDSGTGLMCDLFYLGICLYLLLPFCNVWCQGIDYASANRNSSWLNSGQSLVHYDHYDDTSPSSARVVLLNTESSPVQVDPYYGLGYAFGFLCNLTSCANKQYVLSVFILLINSTDGFDQYSPRPQLVWAANRNRPVGENAKLELTSDGDLLLTDRDGTFVWSANTSGHGVSQMYLQRSGNLVLLDKHNGSVWQSFDHPTDVLVLGQNFSVGLKLVAGISSSNFTEGDYYLELKDTELVLYVKKSQSQPQTYWTWTGGINSTPNFLQFFQLMNGSLDFYTTDNSNAPSMDSQIRFDSYTFLYLKLDPDGRLNVYAYGSDSEWGIYNIDNTEVCSSPRSCGPYGLCTYGQCSCLPVQSGEGSLQSDSFNPVDPFQSNLGCHASIPLACMKTSPPINQHFVALTNVYYFATRYIFDAEPVNSSLACQELCSKNCSCKAAILETITAFNGSSIDGRCYVFTDVYTLENVTPFQYLRNWTVLIRMQTASLDQGSWSKKSKMATLAGSVSALLLIIAFVICFIFIAVKKRQRMLNGDEEFFESFPGLPTRFMYKEICSATRNFSTKLGAGGFGSVFQGRLSDGTQIAVKRLESVKQGQKEFRTEVCIIGSIHHFNLVRLCGFCCEKGHRLLVYEYMPNGSLEHRLFNANPGNHLKWQTRFKIALGTARGLAYLHEECRETILHLDVKPQNILLDDKFEAKVADFGLSKLMDREQSQVVTQIRGTPGYLAPEWLRSGITAKTDVYSYGVVLLELVSGRRTLDLGCGDNSKVYFPKWAASKVRDGHMMDLVDCKLHGSFVPHEVIRAINVSLWCIQEDPEDRPTMSTIVQMLEGHIETITPPFHVLHSHPPLQVRNLTILSDTTPLVSDPDLSAR